MRKPLVAILLLTGFSQSGVATASDPDNALPAVYKAALETAEEYELFSLNPDPGPAKDKNQIYGYGVLGSTKLRKKETRLRVLKEMDEAIAASNHLEQALCFSPRHMIRVHAKKLEVDLLICFECNAVQLCADGKRGSRLAIRALPQRYLDELLADAKVPLTPKPEIVSIAKAAGTVVRNSEGTMIDTKAGFFVVYQEFEKGTGDSDFFPGRLVGMIGDSTGREWGQHRVVVENRKGDINVYSPSLLRLPDQSVLLCFMRYHSFDKAVNKYPPASAYVWISRDDCKTFKPLATLWTERSTALCSATLRRLKSGRLVIPVNRDLSKKGEADHWEAGSFFSDDNGKTWSECTNYVDLPKRGAMEPHVEETTKDKLLMVMRTQLGSIYKATSNDGGKSWSKGESLGIEAPESCPELIKIPKSDDLVLIWNASKYDPKWASHFGKRTPLSAALSRDGGKTWGPPRHIETDANWAFSNPGCYFSESGLAIVNYWACEYQRNGTMSNFPIHLKAAIIEPRWFYGKD